MQRSPLLGAGLAVALIPVLAASPAAPTPPAGENHPPTCVIEGGDITVTAKGPIVTLDLDGCASFDPDGQALTYEWLGCPGSMFSTPNQCTTQMIVDVEAVSLPFTCGVRLVVGDGMGPDSYSACRIYVTILPGDKPDLDIRPGCCPNDVKVKSSCDSTPVALVGTQGFDVSKVDKKTLRLSRVDGIGDDLKPWLVMCWDTATPFEGEGCSCHKLTKDGVPDLYLKFWTPSMVYEFKLKNEKDKTSVPLVLKGKLLTGQSFEVKDCIRVIGGCY